MCRLYLQWCYTSGVCLIFHRERSCGVGASRVIVEQRKQLHQSDRPKVAVRSLLWSGKMYARNHRRPSNPDTAPRPGATWKHSSISPSTSTISSGLTAVPQPFVAFKSWGCRYGIQGICTSRSLGQYMSRNVFQPFAETTNRDGSRFRLPRLRRNHVWADNQAQIRPGATTSPCPTRRYLPYELSC